MNYLQAMKDALVALESDSIPRSEFDRVVANLRNAIAEIEKAEPVAQIDEFGVFKDLTENYLPDGTRLYLHPPLSDEPVKQDMSDIGLVGLP